MAKPTSSTPNSPSTSLGSPSDSESSRATSRSSRSNIKSSSSSTIDKRKRLAANARERKRMHLLNKAYDQLRSRLKDAENKSKYDVLVQAKEYIQALATICEKFDNEQAQQGANYLLGTPPMEPARSPVDLSIYKYNVVCSPCNSTTSTLSQLSYTTSTESIQSPPLLLQNTYHNPSEIQAYHHLNFT